MVLILNDIGTWEVLLILFFVLIFFGSKSIPGLARTLGRTMRQIKNASDDIQTEIRKSGADLKKELNITSIIEDTANDIKRPLDQHAQDLEEALKRKPIHSTPRNQTPPVPETPTGVVPEQPETPKAPVEKPAAPAQKESPKAPEAPKED